MKLIDLIKNGEFIELDVNNTDELFRKLNTILVSRNYVKETFLDSIITREKTYPTGLETELLNIAIPHVDSIHVNQNALFICKVNRGLDFKRMDEIEKNIKVKWIFLILINDDSKHVKVLSDLVRLWQDETLVKNLIISNSKSDIIKLLEDKDNE